MTVAASRPIRFVHPSRCGIRYPLAKGDVRRRTVPGSPTTPWVYDVACPGCGTVGYWFASHAGKAPILEELADGKLIEDCDPIAGAFSRPVSLATDRTLRCPGCRGEISIGEGAIRVSC